MLLIPILLVLLALIVILLLILFVLQVCGGPALKEKEQEKEED